MPVKILSVVPKSPCAKKGFKAGDILISINGNPVNDILDFQFYSIEANPKFVVEKKSGSKKSITIKKKEDQETGLEFETYLMDKQQRCKNNCVFCFIDQLPKGLRESLYFKDDDSRLSFLFGNYITLTNLTQRDVERIIEMRISPVNISVHTMNPDLRVKMMRNAVAGESLSFLKRFAAAGIKMNTQIVLCPGINDGTELAFSLQELGNLYPSVQSIAVVPVGLTEYRDGLFKLDDYQKDSAGRVIDMVDHFNTRFINCNESKIAYPADEFYLKAQRKIPNVAYYSDFPQLENGVGLWALLKDEVFTLLGEKEITQEDFDEAALPVTRRISIATGEAAYPLIVELIDEIAKKWHNLRVDIVKITNNFFGDKITVAGLLTGRDLAEQLEGRVIGDELLIPRVALRREGDLFLDNVTLQELSEKLKVKIVPVPNSGRDFIQAVLGRRA
ncbi:MAG TPA: DUF512 domain-containing protein [Clostridia bacterium]|nr:DUF512 domain-containing protein [Clostridia bacterium]